MPEEPNDLRLYGTEGVLSFRSSEITVYRPDEVTTWTVDPVDRPWYPGRYRAFHRGYFNEFRNLHEAVTYGAPLVGTLLQSIRTMEIVLNGIAAARTGESVAMDETRARLEATALPLWRPHGADDLDIPATRASRAPAPPPE
jgi:predicted dehydrogenase